jgi:hypothetical protein
MIGLVDIIDVAQGGGSGFFASNFVMMIVLFFFAATTALVAYPPSYLKKKYDQYILARSILKGDDVKCLTMIQLIARVIKHHQKIDIRPGERWIQSSVDIGGEVLGSKDLAYINKYWTFAPGVTFHQRPDGLHVRVVDSVTGLSTATTKFESTHSRRSESQGLVTTEATCFWGRTPLSMRLMRP